MRLIDFKSFPSHWKARAVIVALVLTFAISDKESEKLGDAYQIALPVIALGCSLTNGQALDFAARYVIHWSIVHGSKNALGKADINQRPNGKYRGMPSGHTATAVFGASNLVHECVTKTPLVQGLIILTAGFVGGSRIEAEAHSIWQVMVGALVGWGSDRAFRRVEWRDRFRKLWAKIRPDPS